jgi:dihydrofolate reductase
VDTVLMGRKTYEFALKQGTTHYPGARNIVFSRTLTATQDAPVEIVAEEPAEFVRRMKKQAGKGICVMGGGLLAKSLLEADLIDEVVLNIHPVLLGSGIALFPPIRKKLELTLLECKLLAKACILVRYEVNHTGG